MPDTESAIDFLFEVGEPNLPRSRNTLRAMPRCCPFNNNSLGTSTVVNAGVIAYIYQCNVLESNQLQGTAGFEYPG
jgi:hypothetical protein